MEFCGEFRGPRSTRGGQHPGLRDLQAELPSEGGNFLMLMEKRSPLAWEHR